MDKYNTFEQSSTVVHASCAAINISLSSSETYAQGVQRLCSKVVGVCIKRVALAKRRGEGIGVLSDPFKRQVLASSAVTCQCCVDTKSSTTNHYCTAFLLQPVSHVSGYLVQMSRRIKRYVSKPKEYCHLYRRSPNYTSNTDILGG
jgi:hypothetical protein